jgi:glycerol-3-phosphate O-acyltransferase / dihydroxyacetone phosphate acyltransferase
VPANPLPRRVLRTVFRWILGIYFRDIEVTGPAPPKSLQGRILVANHVNGLVDPALVFTQLSAVISPVGKATLWKIPGLRLLMDVAGAIPIMRRQDAPGKSATDNAAVFDKVAMHLADGGNILIFPEGISHNEPRVMPLKSGAARMLLRAKNVGAAGLSYQAIGLEFDARDTFRSRALCVFGPVRNVDDHAEAGDALVERIVGQMAEDLSSLVVEGGDWETHRLVHLAADLFATEEGDTTLERRAELGRRVQAAQAMLSESRAPELAVLRAKLAEYNDQLAAAKTHDRAVAYASRGVGHQRPFRYHVVTPLALLGCALFWLPYQVPRLVAKRASGDEVSTYKLGAGLLSFPLWALVLCLLGLVFARDAWGAIGISALVLTAPFAALYWLDGRERSVEATAPASTTTLLALKQQRAELLVLLAAARLQLDPRASTGE